MGPRLVRTKAEYRHLLADWRRQGLRIGFVPTMGALHAGHGSLAQTARQECDVVVCSIFVNPAQFAPTEDLAKYPKTLDPDLALLAQQVSAPGVDVVYAPEIQDLYPQGIPLQVDQQRGTFVQVHGMSHQMEGAVRPHFFRGVATILTKLLNLVAPSAIYLGQKDVQQCAVVKCLVRDLCWDVQVRVCPTVREADGLAMSSRNRYLGPEQRAVAPRFYAGLQQVETRVRTSPPDGRLSRAEMQDMIAACLPAPEAHPFPVVLEYVSLADPLTLEEVERVGPGGAILSGAVRIGTTRIIDNVLLGVPLSSWQERC